jgi:glycosyltransferase involved in cell wall biosynthesis
MQRPRVALLCGPDNSTTDAIFAYSDRLASMLRATGGVDAALFRSAARGHWLRDADGGCEAGPASGFDAYLLQYNPFSFARRGLAPWLPLAWQRLRKGAHAPMVVTVHEAHVPPHGWRYTVMGNWQRAQLIALLRSSDAAIATCRERSEQLAALWSHTPVTEVPVGSNLDEVEDGARWALRHHLLGPRARPIIATFGNAHPSRSLPHVVRATSAVADVVGELVLLNLGASAPRLSTTPPGVEVVTPGPLGVRDLSVHLSCADLVVLPFINGAITNKTTLMAALQLGRPVLSTRGPSTDDILLGPGLCLLDVDDADGYAAAAVALMRDPAERAALGRRGRELYERAFSWEVVAAQTLEVLGLSGAKALDREAVGIEMTLDDRIP